jgi:hypothetical protein
MALVLLAGLLILGGCSGRAATPVVLYEGTVTYQGKPVSNGGVTFVPLVSTGKPAWAPFVDGRYRCDAVPVGKVRVQIVAARNTGKTVIRENQPTAEQVSIVPDRYRRGIEINVTGDRSDFHLNLSE